MLRDEAGQPITLTGPHIKVEELVPLIPRNAYRKVQLGAQDKRVFYSESASSWIRETASGDQF